tara:strand:+ start:246 stop:821 length:576 start_codon:yes stop_codon:yes gene_type:complete
MSIALAAAAARNEKTDLMPAFSGGMLAHIYGVEQLKAVFAYKGGYTTDAISNLDHALSKSRNVKIMFQNVDIAASPRFEPKANSKIGEAKRGAVEKASPMFFAELNEAEAQRQEKLNAFFSSDAWFICVSYDKNGVPSCEISLPRGIEEGNFAPTFVKRIFIEIGDGFDPEGLRLSDDNPPTDIKPIVSRK